jgi:hypothetical protein
MRSFVQKQNQSPQQLFSQARTRDLPARSSLNLTSPLAHDSVPAIVDEVVQSPGTALDAETRANMEPRFGYDFSNVRVHTNERAAESARAVKALAYTVGNHVVFGAGQHAPFSYGGQKLLAHELAHVVQQDGGPPVLARAPDDGPEGKRIPRGVPQNIVDEEQKKKAAKQKHEDEQRIVIDLMDKARKIQPDPKKDFRDPDNLLRNSVEMFDRGRFRLTVLSPTHYSAQLHFDTRVHHPKIGGDYPLVPPKDPKLPGPGLENESGSLGTFVPFKSASTATIGGIQSQPPKVERAPGEAAPKETTPPPPPTLSTAAPKFSPVTPGDIFLFTRNSDVASEFRQVFVHESQHVADLSTQMAPAGSLDEKMEGYKSEFRGFWIQPTFARTSLLDPGGPRFVEPKGKASNSKQVSITADKLCSVCPRSDASGFVEPKTNFSNPRQEEIFWHILANYPKHGYDCCYVFNKSFHDEVNRFAFPESVNLINSERLMKLNLEFQTWTKSMTKSEISATNFVVLLSQLEPLDWIYLSDTKLSKPFWDSLKAVAPEFVIKGVKALLKKGSKESLSWAEIKKALGIAK